jgi:transketolase
MRNQFVKTVEDIMEKDERVVLLLGDIGVYGFRNAFDRFPNRTYNVGICEQAMVGMAAGLSREGFIPILHSIAPFAVERCLEQIKIDLCYQRLPANIVSVGASYDYSTLGATHHCPGDVAILKAVPEMQIVVPGTPDEFDVLFRKSYDNDVPTYFRLSERSNADSRLVTFDRAELIRGGAEATIIAVGPMLDRVMSAVEGMDVAVLYYTTLSPFDCYSLYHNCPSGNVVVVEPFYEGTLARDVMSTMYGYPIRLLSIGVPRVFLDNYGTVDEHDLELELTWPDIRDRIRRFLHD